ncbi:MAG TPA: PAS domain-containing protein [Rhizomicrobium sp.]|nr:PAS domain-containing protein [Rhizomicrobium sp.]
MSGVSSEADPQILEHPVLRFLRDYWEAKRAGRKMPARADIRPSEMKEHLGWVILVDALADFADFRYRMIGSRVSQYFLQDSTGRTVREAFAPYGEAAVNAVVAVHRKCARDQVVLRSFGGAGWLGRSFLDFDSLYLPLSEDGVTVNMILSCFTFDQAALIRARG